MLKFLIFKCCEKQHIKSNSKKLLTIAMYKYVKFMIDNASKSTKIANAMRRQDVNMASDRGVSKTLYGLKNHCNDKAAFKQWIHFFDRQDRHIVAVDMP